MHTHTIMTFNFICLTLILLKFKYNIINFVKVCVEMRRTSLFPPRKYKKSLLRSYHYLH